MVLKSTSRRSVGKQAATPRRQRKPASPATLAQQKSDFTAEGAPPPGRVSTSTDEPAPVASEPGPAAAKP